MKGILLPLWQRHIEEGGNKGWKVHALLAAHQAQYRRNHVQLLSLDQPEERFVAHQQGDLQGDSSGPVGAQSVLSPTS